MAPSVDAGLSELAVNGGQSGESVSLLESHARPNVTPLTALSPELIDIILSYVDAIDLASLSATNRQLREHAVSDYHWQRCVQDKVPGQTVTKTGPCDSYRDLYISHDMLWFLPEHKIWFCDRDLTGKLIVVRFDQRRGCIEGYQLVAVTKHTTTPHWPAEYSLVHGSEPQVKLHLDKPVLRFVAKDGRQEGDKLFANEIPMALDYGTGAMFSNLLLARPLNGGAADERLAEGYPYGNVWPPPAIPARHRVSGARPGQASVDLSADDRPQSRRQVSNQTFRLRQWFEMGGSPGLMRQVRAITGWLQGHAGSTAVHIGEEVTTFATLDEALYTPTATKPWRGIWVGDYSGHGCEFLLMHQPDDEPATDEELGLKRRERETEEAWQRRRQDARIYRGRLEAIKLTGDPNVPRGEYTFVADDLGPGGFSGVATDAPFIGAQGARVVRSRGHVAATGFVDDKYMDSQLLLISPDHLAQYWVEFGHISFFKRVRVDELLVP
ncbi:hypothetical protein L249_5552 [Ophiocordyceps polyrhachis-furcata BCC 54312]|uniref:F-box domain-containing protein n=1 Tax=Ophiocordyceps polyrhachis-furcata BCC 54312 TaxID=1330021 RepID=A0A367LHA8_9HYPO|nr:hypothetical protein L249_5552 [Ophiocordyceps polyrhachis-furcata BCC 54312]